MMIAFITSQTNRKSGARDRLRSFPNQHQRAARDDLRELPDSPVVQAHTTVAGPGSDVPRSVRAVDVEAARPFTSVGEPVQRPAQHAPGARGRPRGAELEVAVGRWRRGGADGDVEVPDDKLPAHVVE